MSMTKKDFEAIAGALADAQDWIFEEMTPEQMRKALGERLLYVCQAAHKNSGYSFDTGKFLRVAKLDDELTRFGRARTARPVPARGRIRKREGNRS